MNNSYFGTDELDDSEEKKPWNDSLFKILYILNITLMKITNILISNFDLTQFKNNYTKKWLHYQVVWQFKKL